MDLDNITACNYIEEEIIEDLKSGRIKEVITRCPPEPSGYFHIGHCKAWVIDFETALKFGGYTNLRMDDTNPTKEDGEFADSYLEDFAWLGYTPKKVIYASLEYFDGIYECAEKMIKNGDAYVCELSAEEVANTRGTLTTPGTNSPYRNRSIEENLKLFRDMRDGKFEDGKATLRAKIDMAHPNINMRDPIMYRVLHATHYKLGDKWCIYPMYDFAHPLQDAMEGVTYSMCDIGFRDHRILYEWFLNKAIDFEPKPKQREFGKLNLENVLLGKRYLKRLVNDGCVIGWDDPRFLTIRGMRRRGYTATGIKNFVNSLGVTVTDSTLPFSALEYYIREDLNKIANRAMVVTKPLKVIITNYNSDADEDIIIENNPNNADAGTHLSKFGKVIYIEQEDFSLNPPPKYNRLVLGGMVRLKNAYIIKCNNVVLNNSGEIDYLECEYLPNTHSGSDDSGIKVKGTIQFVHENNCFKITIRNFKNLVKDECVNPAKDLAEGKELNEILNEDSMTETSALAENYLKTAKVFDKFQFMRIGYFTLDIDSTEDNYIFNSTIGLKDSYKPTIQN